MLARAARRGCCQPRRRGAAGPRRRAIPAAARAPLDAAIPLEEPAPPEIPWLDLAHGVNARSPIGVCVHEAGCDLGRAVPTVRFVDNGVDVETVDFPVPAPDVSFGER